MQDFFPNICDIFVNIWVLFYFINTNSKYIFTGRPKASTGITCTLLRSKISLVNLMCFSFFPFCRCGYDQIFPDPSHHPLDGMLGLGRGKTSLTSQLNSQGLVRNVIGHCLSAQGGGYIFFGDVYDSSRLTWTPMSSRDQ